MQIEGMTSIKLGSSELLYAESWLANADQWFERLKNEVPWSAETVRMYGKPLVLRRETCNYGDDYDYNANAKPAIEWGGPVLELKSMLERLTGRAFTQCACNLYPDGETGIGLHHDKRHPLLVASISFGAVRTMGFAPKGGKLDKSLPMVPLAPGSLLLFSDAVNENFKHAIVGDKSVRGPRISVTFREFSKSDPTPSRAGSGVTRQMSRNLVAPVVAAPAFQSVPDFLSAYNAKKKTIDDLTAKFALKAAEAKQMQDDILPHLAYMQSLLSKKGANHHLVIASRKQGKKIPWWTEYYESYKERLWESLRTMERRIAAYRNDPSVRPTKPGSGKGGDKPKHLTRLEHKLLGTATSVHEALTDIHAGRVDDAVKKLKENLPTQDRIDEYLERGVNPTHANPDGHVKAQADNSKRQQGTKEPIEPPLTLPASAPVPQTATYGDWENHRIPAPDFKLKYFKAASGNFTDHCHYAFHGSAFKKILAMLKDKPDQVLSNAQDFAQLATVLRSVAENANLLANVITTALTPSPEPESQPMPEPEEPREEQNTGQHDPDLTVLANEETEPETSELKSLTPDAPASTPQAAQKEKSTNEYTLNQHPTTNVGDKSEPTAHGFFFEMRLHEKLPYVVRDANNPNLGILCECKNKADAEMKVATYEREAAEAMAAAVDGGAIKKVQFAVDRILGTAAERTAADCAALGECEWCLASATETVGSDKLCAKCAADSREYDRKRLVLDMGVKKVCGKVWSWKSLPDEPKTIDLGDGDTCQSPTKSSYLAALRSEFLGNPRFDRRLVEEYVARVEKRMKKGEVISPVSPVPKECKKCGSRRTARREGEPDAQG